MKTIKIILFILLVIPKLSIAGEIYGTLIKEGKPYNNCTVQIKNKETNALIKTCKTDEKGFYSLDVATAGDYTLEVLDEKGASIAKIVVFSNDGSTNYNLKLVKDGKGWKLTFQ